MRYIWNHINTIISSYTCQLPLAHYLKTYFRQHPALGSRDRRILSEMAYCWYRAAKGFPAELAMRTRLECSLLICDTNESKVLGLLPESFQHVKSLPLQEKLIFLNPIASWNTEHLAPTVPVLSEGLTKDEWLMSMLRQPSLFIRIRARRSQVIKALNEKGISYNTRDQDVIELPNGTPIDQILRAEDYVVQDLSSRRTGSFFQPRKGQKWWDCCSGAGGKSLLLMDQEPNIHLTVTDKRASILHNLRQRFRLYDLPLPESIVVDATDASQLSRHLTGKMFDQIICDVPCSGSGTWARTPEQLYFFEPSIVQEYATRQSAIALNAVNFLKKGGRLIYVTCSVFRQENEEVVEHLTREGLSIESMNLLNGVGERADSMFVAVLKS